MIEANPLPISMITNHHLSTTRGDPFEDVMLYQSVVSATTTEMLIDVGQKMTSKLLTSVKKRRLGK